MKFDKSTIKIFLLLSGSLVWSSQNLAFSFAGGNVRIGFLLFILLALIEKNQILKKNSLIAVITISIIGLLSSFTALSGKPIFYTFLLLGNFVIISYLFCKFEKVAIQHVDKAIILHLLSLILLLVGENILSDDRPHLFFKEPSYLGIYLSGYVVYGVIRNIPVIIFLSGAIAFLCVSMFSIISIFLGALLLIIRNFKFNSSSAVRFTTLLAVFVMLSPLLLDFLNKNRYARDFGKLMSNFHFEAFIDFLIFRGGSRIDRMLSALHYYLNHTNYIFGIGPGNFINVNNDVDNFGYTQINTEQPGYGGSAINIFIEFLVEYGILASLFLLCFLIIKIKRYSISMLYLSPVLVCMFFEGSYLRPAYWISVLLVAVASQRIATVTRSG